MLFQTHYCRHPDEIPDSLPAGELSTRVTDYLAGMTDRYCIRRFEELTVPVAFARQLDDRSGRRRGTAA